MTVQIVLADDHPLIRKGIQALLSNHIEYAVVGECGLLSNLEATVHATRPDVLVLDYYLGDGHSLGAIVPLKQKFPSLRVLLLTLVKPEQIVRAALDAGADGVLNKEMAPECLLDALNTLRSGKTYLPAGITDNKNQGPLFILSERERTVFSSIISGKTVSAISKDLELSVKTVSTYKRRIMDKLLLENQADLMKYAFKYSLI